MSHTAFHLQPLLDLSKMRLDEATRELGQLIAGEQEASQPACDTDAIP
jgi:flagellar biosynthesis chaperone FliJ